MRIVFFGSSHGVPEPGRRCSSAMIEVGERRYFIDMGTQSIEQLITRRWHRIPSRGFSSPICTATIPTV